MHIMPEEKQNLSTEARGDGTLADGHGAGEAATSVPLRHLSGRGKKPVTLWRYYPDAVELIETRRELRFLHPTPKLF